MSFNGRVTNIMIKPIARDLLKQLRDASESKRRENQTYMLQNESIKNAYTVIQKKESLSKLRSSSPVS